jgi:hypothetical protein
VVTALSFLLPRSRSPPAVLVLQDLLLTSAEEEEEEEGNEPTQFQPGTSGNVATQFQPDEPGRLGKKGSEKTYPSMGRLARACGIDPSNAGKALKKAKEKLPSSADCVHFRNGGQDLVCYRTL